MLMDATKQHPDDTAGRGVQRPGRRMVDGSPSHGGDADGAGSLWIVDTVAHTARKTDGLVLDDEALLWRPPDGRQLAVLAQEPQGQLRFALVTPGVDSVDYLAPVGYLGGQFRAGGWTPDGSRFVYASDPPWGQVHVLEVDGGRDVQIQPSMAGRARSTHGCRTTVDVSCSWNRGPRTRAGCPSPQATGARLAVRVSDIYPEGIGTHYSWSPDDRSIEFEPNVGPHVVLDPAGGPATTPSWVAEGAESWQRRAP